MYSDEADEATGSGHDREVRGIMLGLPTSEPTLGSIDYTNKRIGLIVLHTYLGCM